MTRSRTQPSFALVRLGVAQLEERPEPVEPVEPVAEPLAADELLVVAAEDLGRLGLVEERPQPYVGRAEADGLLEAPAHDRVERARGYLGVVPHPAAQHTQAGAGEASAGFEEHAEVERRRRVGERADRDRVDAGRGDLGDVRA